MDNNDCLIISEVPVLEIENCKICYILKLLLRTGPVRFVCPLPSRPFHSAHYECTNRRFPVLLCRHKLYRQLLIFGIPYVLDYTHG